MKVEKDYEELLQLLNKNNVKYCVIGAYAVALYAQPRYTKDIDILIEPEIENSRRVVKSLEEFGFKNAGLTEKDFIHKGRVIQLGYEPLRVDILTSVKGVTFKEIWQKKRTSRYGKQKVFFIGPRELIKNKKAAGRRQDKADLEILNKVIM
jgi:hypothetical protein